MFQLCAADALGPFRRLRSRAQAAVHATAPVSHGRTLARRAAPRLGTTPLGLQEVAGWIAIPEPAAPLSTGCCGHSCHLSPLLAPGVQPSSAPQSPPGHRLRHARVARRSSASLRCETSLTPTALPSRPASAAPPHLSAARNRLVQLRSSRPSEELHRHVVSRSHLVAEHLFNRVARPHRKALLQDRTLRGTFP